MCFDIYMFAKRLKTARKAKGLTQEALADELGMASPVHISKMEQGVRGCSIDTLFALARVLGVTADYLIGSDQFEKNNITSSDAEKGRQENKKTNKERALNLLEELRNTIMDLD